MVEIVLQSGEHLEYPSPAGATFAFVRYCLARFTSAPLNDLEFGDRSLDAVVDEGPVTVQSRAFKVTVGFQGKPRRQFQLECSALDRCYDLRMRVASVARANPNGLELFLDGKPLDDETFIGQLGIWQEQIIKCRVRPTPICRLYFSDLAGNRQIVDVAESASTTFEELAPMFHSAPIAVAFWGTDGEIKWTTRASTVQCHPAFPIELRLRPVVVKLALTAEAERNVVIDPNATVGDIVAQIRRQFPGSLISVYFGDVLLRDDQVLLEVNPSLASPFKVDIRDKPPALLECLFSCRNTTTPLTFTFNTAVADKARRLWAREKGVPAQSLCIYRKSRLVQNAERLKTYGHYEVVMMTKVRTVAMSLNPLPTERFTRKLRQEFAFESDKYRTAQQLETFLAEILKLATVSLFRVGHDRPVPPTTLSEMLSDLWITFDVARAVKIGYLFSVRDKPKQKKQVEVKANQKVIDVKLSLLRQLNDFQRLPRVLSFWFWGCELEDHDIFLGYGIPAGSKIVVDSKEKHEIKLKDFEDKEDLYLFWEGDSIDDLEMAFSRRHKIAEGTAGIFDGDVKVPGHRDLSEFEDCVLTARPVRREFTFLFCKEPVSILLPMDATANDAKEQIAKDEDVSVDQITLRCLGTTILNRFARLDPRQDIQVRMRKTVYFTYQNEQVPLLIDPHWPFEKVVHMLAAAVNIEASALEIRFDGAVVDRKMSVRDCGLSPHLEVRRKARRSNADEPQQRRRPTVSVSPSCGLMLLPHPSLMEFRVTLATETIPRNGKVLLEPTATIRDLERACWSKYGLNPDDCEIVVRHDATQVDERIRRETPLTTIDSDHSLVMIKSRDGMMLSGRESLFMTFTQRSRMPDLEIQFKVPQTGTNFALLFNQQDTVKEAKRRVSQQIELDDRRFCISLLLGTRMLVDSHLLIRLGIGNQTITVDIKNRHPLQTLDLSTALLAYVSRKISQRYARGDPGEVPDSGTCQTKF
jgi:hypothetical protein